MFVFVSAARVKKTPSRQADAATSSFDPFDDRGMSEFCSNKFDEVTKYLLRGCLLFYYFYQISSFLFKDANLESTVSCEEDLGILFRLANV